VYKANEQSAVERARWLAEVSAALNQAKRLVQELGAEGGRLEAIELYAHIEALRFEIEAMRMRRAVRPLSPEHPNRTNLWAEPAVRGTGSHTDRSIAAA
jgi:hypothetical protein